MKDVGHNPCGAMSAIAMHGKQNARSSWMVPALEGGADHKIDAGASRTAFPRWSVGTINIEAGLRSGDIRQAICACRRR